MVWMLVFAACILATAAHQPVGSEPDGNVVMAAKPWTQALFAYPAPFVSTGYATSPSMVNSLGAGYGAPAMVPQYASLPCGAQPQLQQPCAVAPAPACGCIAAPSCGCAVAALKSPTPPTSPPVISFTNAPILPTVFYVALATDISQVGYRFKDHVKKDLLRRLSGLRYDRMQVSVYASGSVILKVAVLDRRGEHYARKAERAFQAGRLPVIAGVRCTLVCYSSGMSCRRLAGEGYEYGHTPRTSPPRTPPRHRPHRPRRPRTRPPRHHHSCKGKFQCHMKMAHVCKEMFTDTRITEIRGHSLQQCKAKCERLQTRVCMYDARKFVCSLNKNRFHRPVWKKCTLVKDIFHKDRYYTGLCNRCGAWAGRGVHHVKPTRHKTRRKH